MTDLSIWTLLTDLQPYQQAAAIVMRLQGTAREYARMINPNELMHGGIQNGVHVDPVTYILAGLHARFSPLEEESRLTAMTEMMAFARRPGEPINSVLSRYEIVRQRAALEGQFHLPVEVCALQIFRAIGVGPQQMLPILQPLSGQLPTTAQEFNMVCMNLRRYGHITENAPGNIGQALHGPFRQARPGAYFGDAAGAEQPLEAQDGTQRANAMRTFFGDHNDAQSSNWDPSATQPLLYDPDNNPNPLWNVAEQPWDGGGHRADATPWAAPQDAYTYAVDLESDPSSSATSSDDHYEEVDMPGITNMSTDEAAEFLY